MKSYWKNKNILVTGGKGFVGRHVVENLIEKRGVRYDRIKVPDSQKDDLRDYVNARKSVRNIDIILHLAADVGGIGYSSNYPATQFRNCMLVDLNILEAAAEERVKKIVLTSSSVAYPEQASSPLKEKRLFSGPPAMSGYGYGFAKRMDIVLAKAYRQEKGLDTAVILPNNAYGPGENIDLETAHVIPSLIRKCLTQEKLVVWGDGSAVRDFLYVKDFAEGVLLAAEHLRDSTPINLGSGIKVSIRQLVELIIEHTDFKGKVFYDTNKPKGQAERVVNISKAKKLLSFTPSYALEKGIAETVSWLRNKLQ